MSQTKYKVRSLNKLLGEISKVESKTPRDKGLKHALSNTTGMEWNETLGGNNIKLKSSSKSKKIESNKYNKYNKIKQKSVAKLPLTYRKALSKSKKIESNKYNMIKSKKNMVSKMNASLMREKTSVADVIKAQKAYLKRKNIFNVSV